MTVRLVRGLDVFAVRQQLEDALGDGLNFVVSTPQIIDVMKTRGWTREAACGISRSCGESTGRNVCPSGPVPPMISGSLKRAAGRSRWQTRPGDQGKGRFVADSNERQGVTRAIRATFRGTVKSCRKTGGFWLYIRAREHILKES